MWAFASYTQPVFTWSELTIETIEQGVKCVVLVSLLWTLAYVAPCSNVSVVNFEHVITGWYTPLRHVHLWPNFLNLYYYGS